MQDALRWHQRLLDSETAAEQLPDRDCHHRSLILVNYAISHAVAERCFAQRRDLWALAGNPHTPYEFVQRLAREADPTIRARVAARCDLDPELRARLAGDPDPTVRTRILVHEPPPTEPQRRMIDYFIGKSADEIGTIHEWFKPPAPDWFASCAISRHPLLRRIAATFPHLPANLAELLDHQDPEVRALAAADTTLPQPPLAQLADSDTRVREAAVANPLLPADLLNELLDNPDHARAAASNSNLPAEHLHGLLDRAGIPRSANAGLRHRGMS